MLNSNFKKHFRWISATFVLLKPNRIYIAEEFVFIESKLYKYRQESCANVLKSFINWFKKIILTWKTIFRQLLFTSRIQFWTASLMIYKRYIRDKPIVGFWLPWHTGISPFHFPIVILFSSTTQSILADCMSSSSNPFTHLKDMLSGNLFIFLLECRTMLLSDTFGGWQTTPKTW